MSWYGNGRQSTLGFPYNYLRYQMEISWDPTAHNYLASFYYVDPDNVLHLMSQGYASSFDCATGAMTFHVAYLGSVTSPDGTFDFTLVVT